MKIIVFCDRSGEWRYTLIARNGEKIASSEGYTKKSNALKAARKLAKLFKVVPRVQVEETI